MPNYTQSLDWMHEAEMTLTMSQTWEYHGHLIPFAVRAADDANSIPIHRWAHGVTAPQRAEAFLRTIGKWDDSK